MKSMIICTKCGHRNLNTDYSLLGLKYTATYADGMIHATAPIHKGSVICNCAICGKCNRIIFPSGAMLNKCKKDIKRNVKEETGFDVVKITSLVR